LFDFETKKKGLYTGSKQIREKFNFSNRSSQGWRVDRVLLRLTSWVTHSSVVFKTKLGFCYKFKIFLKDVFH